MTSINDLKLNSSLNIRIEDFYIAKCITYNKIIAFVPENTRDETKLR